MAQKAEVTYDPDVVTPEAIREMIEDIGFDAEILEGIAKGGVETVTLIVSQKSLYITFIYKLRLFQIKQESG